MAKLEQIQAKMNQLQARADALISKKAQAAIDQIRDIMLKHGLTTEDIEAKAKSKRQAKASNGSAGHVKAKASDGVKGKAAPKHQHPKTGATWTGRGRAPAWIAEAKDRNKFLIAGGAEAAVSVSASVVSKAKVALKKTASKSDGVAGGNGQRKGSQPALYRDPKTGATWSGRGRAPGWLAGARDRAKFLIDGASAAADMSASTRTKPSANKAVARRAVFEKVAATKAASTKKIAVKRVGARKAVSAKVPAKKAPAKKALRQSVAMSAAVAAVESGAGSTT